MELELVGLTKRYGEKVVLSNLNQKFDLNGQITAIVGKSGEGKSTLLNILFGIDQDYEGKYLIDQKDARKYSDREWDDLRRQQIQIVYQDFKLLESFTVRENLSFSNNSDQDFLPRFTKLMKLLGLEDISNTQVRNISGGQKQRVAVARALLNEPSVILMDEPTGNLDKTHTEELLVYLEKIKQTGISIVIISHDDRVLPFADNIYRLTEGKLDLEQQATSGTPANEDHSKPILKKTKKSLLTLGNYSRLDVLHNLKEFILISLPMVLILAVFMLVLSAYKQVSLDSLTDIFKGLPDNVIYLDSQTLKEPYQKKLSKQHIESSTDGARIYFSKQDLKDVKTIAQVKKVLAFDTTISILDRSDNELQERLEKKDLPEIFKSYRSYGSVPEQTPIVFQSIMLPAQDLKDYNPQEIQLSEGEFPSKNDDVLIPDFYKIYLTQKKQNTKNISLKIRTEHDDFREKKYHVSGTYVTDYQNDLRPATKFGGTNVFAFYTKFHDLTDLTAMKSKESYKNYKTSFSVNEATKNYSQQIIGSYQQYRKSVGVGKPGLLVVANNKSDVATISKQLEKMFPYYQQKSRYALKNGDFSAIYRKLVLSLVLGVSVVAVLLTVIFVLLNKQTISHKKKELAILFSLGYSKSNVKSILSMEIFTQFIVIYLGSIGILALARYFILDHLSYRRFFINLFSGSNQLLMLIIIILATLVSVVWGTASIKKKKLIESLK